MWTLALLAACAAADEPVDIGGRLELFADHRLVARLDGAAGRLGALRSRGPVLRFDEPWEGPFSGYVTVLHDPPLYRAYYRGLSKAGRDGSPAEVTCCAVSTDGVHWTKPKLGLYAIEGTRENNVILAGMPPFSHNFAPFIDARPGVPGKERYKALAGTRESGLFAFVSEDGYHWRMLREDPVITEGAFDSQNVAFWSEHEGVYCCYLRVFSEGYRSVARCTSEDFLNWTEPVEMNFGDTPREHIYTNQTVPYVRAPHLYIGLAARFLPGRRVVSAETTARLGVAEQYGGDCSDGVMLTSRGGARYDRTFMEAFIRPGMGAENWTSRTNYPARGIVPLGEETLGVYAQRHYAQDSAHLELLTLPPDRFASIHAGYEGGEMVTVPLTFRGGELALNASTSAAGEIRVGVLDGDGQPLPAFGIETCLPVTGDGLELPVAWDGEPGLAELQGRPIRLRFALRDADLFAFRFK